ncbi:MAG: hypothetical protein HKN42_04810 [Granulosicoccus sp.]|nr:hypothetical protein [Granulosicoccus sp.]
MKSLDKKLKHIKGGKYKPSEFIIADAKDGDMAFGVTSPGPAGKGRWKSREDYLDAMQQMSDSGLVDIMLMSASSAEILKQRGTFSKSPVTPAVRMNDTTDIWNARGSCYRQYPSEPFATADLQAVTPLCKLGLYSMTFSNDLQADKASLQAYGEFRLACRETGFRHFLEIFNPAFDIGVADAELGHYINDMIIKALAGVTHADYPLFLKIQFNGRDAMQELTHYDPSRLVAGILGGAAGTTRDTFELALQAEQSGARVALFGRKINRSESPVKLVELIRRTIEKDVSPAEAVQQFHAHLKQEGIKPQRSLKDDLKITEPILKL